jgi:hypothetical protein
MNQSGINYSASPDKACRNSCEIIKAPNCNWAEPNLSHARFMKLFKTSFQYLARP